MNESGVSIERLTDYNLVDARGIGKLMPMLSSRFTGEPVPEERLRHIIESLDADQLVARLNAQIVGAATLSLVYGAAMDRMAYLEDFVIDTEVRGLGIGRKLFSGVKQWAIDRDVALEFTSGDTNMRFIYPRVRLFAKRMFSISTPDLLVVASETVAPRRCVEV